ncbi:hypothetical protein BDK51DRAFT_48027 [Blyttiomyces helicus]|uniref:Uncharacterized protein n=1 Tax=Blyttiomyces helicus TaxID=388810 RepID=A0A4P9VZL0_9FUNG|nr:hypothetical protein BDK51DRAFT_48027 [Blyttiomyces helicus]|eukprot:RKO84772.1 hypothetical protein BDK51DRAFT_48027 [Blyttiomyces helicus]
MWEAEAVQGRRGPITLADVVRTLAEVVAAVARLELSLGEVRGDIADIRRELKEMHKAVSWLGEVAAAHTAKALAEKWGQELVFSNLPYSRNMPTKVVSDLSRLQYRDAVEASLPPDLGEYSASDSRLFLPAKSVIDIDLFGKIMDPKAAFPVTLLESPLALPPTASSSSPGPAERPFHGVLIGESSRSTSLPLHPSQWSCPSPQDTLITGSTKVAAKLWQNEKEVVVAGAYYGTLWPWRALCSSAEAGTHWTVLNFSSNVLFNPTPPSSSILIHTCDHDLQLLCRDRYPSDSFVLMVDAPLTLPEWVNPNPKYMRDLGSANRSLAGGTKRLWAAAQTVRIEDWRQIAFEMAASKPSDASIAPLNASKTASSAISRFHCRLIRTWKKKSIKHIEKRRQTTTHIAQLNQARLKTSTPTTADPAPATEDAAPFADSTMPHPQSVPTAPSTPRARTPSEGLDRLRRGMSGSRAA